MLNANRNNQKTNYTRCPKRQIMLSNQYYIIWIMMYANMIHSSIDIIVIQPIYPIYLYYIYVQYILCRWLIGRSAALIIMQCEWFRLYFFFKWNIMAIPLRISIMMCCQKWILQFFYLFARYSSCSIWYS